MNNFNQNISNTGLYNNGLFNNGMNYGNFNPNPVQNNFGGLNAYNLLHYNIIQVNGQKGAETLQMAPNSKVLLLDETDPKNYLMRMAQQLEQMNEREAARKLDHLIEHVEKEIETAENKMMDLESTGYDMAYILQQQNELQRHYAEKIRTMNDKNLQFRRRGEGNYTNYNFSEDDYEMDNYNYEHDYNNYRRGYYR